VVKDDRRKKFATDGEMKSKMLTLTLALSLNCGCAGRMNTDLLQALIREQSTQLSESQREIAKTRSELKRTKDEAERLKLELNQSGNENAAANLPQGKIHKIHIHSLASGGLNKDQKPGDDAVVIQFVPVDFENEPIKVPGELEIRLLDPLLPESDRELGRWTFSADECRSHWTRGITSSGFQFTLPFEETPLHTDLVVHLRFQSLDDRRYDTSHVVKVVLAPESTRIQVKRQRQRPVQTVENSDEFLPPAGDGLQARDESDNDCAQDDSDEATSKPGHTVLHSSNWTDATIPQLR
jgi:hypothetical protein